MLQPLSEFGLKLVAREESFDEEIEEASSIRCFFSRWEVEG